MSGVSCESLASGRSLKLVNEELDVKKCGCPDFLERRPKGRKHGCGYFKWIDKKVTVPPHLVELIKENRRERNKPRMLERENAQLRAEARPGQFGEGRIGQFVSESVEEEGEEVMCALLADVEETTERSRASACWWKSALSIGIIVAILAGIGIGRAM